MKETITMINTLFEIEGWSRLCAGYVLEVIEHGMSGEEAKDEYIYRLAEDGVPKDILEALWNYMYTHYDEKLTAQYKKIRDKHSRLKEILNH